MRLLTVAESTRDFDADLVYTPTLKDGHWEGEAWGRRGRIDLPPVAVWPEPCARRQQQHHHSITLFRDITLQREAQGRIQRLAHFDPSPICPIVRSAERAQRHIEQASRGVTLLCCSWTTDHFQERQRLAGTSHRRHPAGGRGVAVEPLLGTQDTVSRLGAMNFSVVTRRLRDAGADASAWLRWPSLFRSSLTN